MRKRIAPDYIADHITDIPISFLKENDIRLVIVDLDNTLAPRDKEKIPVECKGWINKVSENEISVIIVSNNFKERVKKAVSGCNVYSVIAPASKPFVKKLKDVVNEKFKDKKAILIGDQVFTDIIAAKRLKILSILVMPLSKYDLPHTKLLRMIEKKLLKFWLNKNLTKYLGEEINND